MENLHKLYELIRLTDGRQGIIVDSLGDTFIVNIADEAGNWNAVQAIKTADEFLIIDDNGKVYELCPRKGVRLHISEDNVYSFLLEDHFADEIICFNEQQFKWLCDLLGIDFANLEECWSDYFEFNNFKAFLNAYKIVTANEFYYAYGYDAEEKTADALYRFCGGRFERYFPRESTWREMPEQRMILKDKKPRYSRVSEKEGLSLALLV